MSKIDRFLWHLKKTLRIGRWEVSKGVGELNKKFVAIIILGIIVLAGISPLFLSSGISPNNDIYKVGVSDNDEYYEPIIRDNQLNRQPINSNKDNLDLVIERDQIYVFSKYDKKGKASVSQLRNAIESYNQFLMTREENQTAAFPVTVSLTYIEQQNNVIDNQDENTGSSTSESENMENQDIGNSNDSVTVPSPDSNNADVNNLPSAGIGETGIFSDNNNLRSPSNINPPFPFESLVLAFIFIVPINFIVQAYASSIMKERLNRRGELMLVSPVSKWDIISGKTLPYLTVMMILTALIALIVGGGLISVLSVFPIVLLFLSSCFVGGMFSRSYKELTFVIVGLSVFITSYIFIPAIFTDIHPISAISPVTMIVQELRGTSVSLGDYVFSTFPLYFSSLVLFLLGGGVYQEEDMFHQLPVPTMFLDSLANRIHRRSSVFKLSILFIPFVLAFELLGIATLFALPVSVTLPVLLLSISIIEELFKSVHIFAGYTNSLFDSSFKSSILIGTLSGLGFFLGEKVTVITQLVRLPSLTLGRTAFSIGNGIGGIDAGPFLLLALFFAPLLLHTITTTISSLGARRNLRYYAVGLLVAVLIHTTYNLTVVSFLG